MLGLIDMLNCFGSLVHNNKWSLISEELQKSNGLVSLAYKKTIPFSAGDFMQRNNMQPLHSGPYFFALSRFFPKNNESDCSDKKRPHEVCELKVHTTG